MYLYVLIKHIFSIDLAKSRSINSFREHASKAAVVEIFGIRLGKEMSSNSAGER